MTPQAFKTARRELGLTQQAMAKLLGVSRGTISRYEMASNPYQIPETVVKLLNHLLTQRP